VVVWSLRWELGIFVARDTLWMTCARVVVGERVVESVVGALVLRPPIWIRIGRGACSGVLVGFGVRLGIGRRSKME
jgi:hypothetical protein